MLYLASKSPRRQQLLQQVGVAFEAIEVEIHEQRLAGEPALDYVSRVAREKAGAGLLALRRADARVLGADTEVVLDDHVFGKPADATEAAAMLGRLQGRTHEVISVVWCMDGSREEHVLSRSEVRFAPLDAAAIAAYVGCGEWAGKAGGYAVQGRAAAFVAHLSGSYSGVMGLPLYETAQLLARFGISVIGDRAAGASVADGETNRSTAREHG